MLLGIAGALVAGFVGQAIGLYRDRGDAPGSVMSILGAILLLVIYRVATRRRTLVRPLVRP